MKRKPSSANLSAAVLVVLSAAAAVALLAIRPGLMPTPSEQQMGGLAVGSPVPAIGAEAWVNGPPPADYDGKVIVVHGWFLNCPYCWEEAPGLGDLARSYAGSDVEFVGLSPDEVSRASAVQEFVEKGGLPYPVGFGARDALLGFEAEYFPAVWVVDRTGKVVWNKAYEPYVSLEEAIEQALAGDEPSA